jgi:hypothetical protein
METNLRRNDKTADKYSWNQYLSFCKRLCPKHISFDILTMVVPFFTAYENGVSHRTLMCEIEHVESLSWLTAEQRIDRIMTIINN